MDPLLKGGGLGDVGLFPLLLSLLKEADLDLWSSLWGSLPLEEDLSWGLVMGEETP